MELHNRERQLPYWILFPVFSSGVIPYGAQMLVAISAVNELGVRFAFQIMPKLFYPMLTYAQFSDHNHEKFRPQELKDSQPEAIFFNFFQKYLTFLLVEAV